MTPRLGGAVSSDALRAGFAVAARIADGHGDTAEHEADSAQEAAAAALAPPQGDDWWQTATAQQIPQA